MDSENKNDSLLKVYNMMLYFTGTMLMYEPSEECISDFWANDILKKLPISSSNPNFSKAATLLRDSLTDKTISGKSLREDFARLFSGMENDALAPPYESFYRKDGTSGSGYEPLKVTDFYQRYGWESKFKSRIKDDHLAIELLFLTRLIDKYVTLDDGPSRNEMRKEIRRFIDYHILSWVPEWTKKLQLHSNTLSFKGVATLILACTEDIFALFNQEAVSEIPVKNVRSLD